MALITRTAMIQARVFPPIKEASERVLSRIGLNMSEAMELFLRRVIIDERIPFEIEALEIGALTAIEQALAPRTPPEEIDNRSVQRLKKVLTKEKKNSKSFSGVTSSQHFRQRKSPKKG